MKLKYIPHKSLLSYLKMHKSKTIKRGCVVCAKKISIKIYPDGYYRNAHYFGVMKIPVKGTGEYKKTGVTKLGMKQVDVVKWTGKENKVEYWECESCYEEAKHENWLEKTIEKLYGKRCSFPYVVVILLGS